MGLLGWHAGERSIRAKFGYDKDPNLSDLYEHIDASLPGQHALFHSTRLHFLPVCTLDEKGRPWGSIVAGPQGELGFIHYLNATKLRFSIKSWVGDPFLGHVRNGEKGEDDLLIAGIGIEFSTRRRNKLAGKVAKVNRLDENERTCEFDLDVNQALGNCPKYITVRQFDSHPDTHPQIAYQNLNVSDPEERLPDEVVAFVHESDTVFIGTVYLAEKEEASKYPSHLGMNQRGGRKGFVRVSQKDGRTVVLPDLSGNRFMTSLGNIEATPLASLTFIDFVSGDILYLTGNATNHIGSSSQEIMPFQNALTTVYVTGYTLVRGALPVRQKEGTQPEPSPYSPPIRYLAEEKAPPSLLKSEEVKATLTRIQIHSASLATFSWRTSEEIQIKPGQAVIMDFSPFVGARQYAHMSAMKPSLVNDDRIRTWTVSSAHAGNKTRVFELTMREKDGGLVTGALFAIARKLKEAGMKELLDDSERLGLSVGVVGVSGEFVLPEKGRGMRKKLLWVAGGIGVTPFISMLGGMRLTGRTENDDATWDIRLVLSTREPSVLLSLLGQTVRDSALGSGLLRLNIDVFNSVPAPKSDTAFPDGVNVEVMYHEGRLSPEFFTKEICEGREVYVCGPVDFENGAIDGVVRNGGVDRKEVRREGFAY